MSFCFFNSFFRTVTYQIHKSTTTPKKGGLNGNPKRVLIVSHPSTMIPTYGAYLARSFYLSVIPVPVEAKFTPPVGAKFTPWNLSIFFV